MHEFTYASATLIYVDTGDRANLTLSVPKNFIRRLRVYAAEQDQSMSSVVMKAVLQVIDLEGDVKKAEERFFDRIRSAPDRGTRGRIAWTRDEIHER